MRAAATRRAGGNDEGCWALDPSDDPLVDDSLDRIAASSLRVRMARRFHNDAVREVRRVRGKRVVRWFRLAGHAAQTSPRVVSVLVDWVHLAAASVWLGGLAGLLVIAATLPRGERSDGLVPAAMRFSPVAIGSVLLIVASGVGASILHLPLLSALWQTSYGVAILVKAGLVLAALAVAALHRRGKRPWPVALGVETALVVGTVLAAAILSSLPPPAAALAEQSQSLASVGPGKVASTLHVKGYTLQVLVAPNTAIKPNSFALRITKNGQPVRGADVRLGFEMLDMQMGNETYQLVESSPGVYTRAAPALIMAGRWALQFAITPRGGVPFNALVIDHATG